MINNELNNPLYNWSERALDFPNGEYYDSYQYRVMRYNAYRYSYANLLYTSLFYGLTTLRNNHKLYSYIRGIYNPVHKLVETLAAYIYGGAIDTDFRQGALPIDYTGKGSRDTLVEGLRYLSKTSDLRNLKKNYASWCANLGDIFLVVQDDIDLGFVRLTVVQPDKVLDYETNSKDEITSIRFSYSEKDDLEQEHFYIYDMDINTFTLYESTVNKGIGNIHTELQYEPELRVIEVMQNPYGFVPVVHQKYIDLGTKYGGNAYFAQWHQIHIMNDVLSILNDGIRKDVDTVYAGINMSADLKGTRVSQGRDSVKIIYLPTGELQPLTSDLDIASSAKYVFDLIKMFESSMPVLALQAIRDMSIITEPAIAAAYGDSIRRVEDSQNILDSGLERGLVMALAIAGYRGYIQGFRLNYVNEFDSGWNLRTRPVISSAVDSSTKINALAGADVNNPLLPIMLRMMNVPEDEIKEATQQGDKIMSQQAGSALLSASRNRLDELRNAGRDINAQRTNIDNQGDLQGG